VASDCVEERRRLLEIIIRGYIPTGHFHKMTAALKKRREQSKQFACKLYSFFHDYNLIKKLRETDNFDFFCSYLGSVITTATISGK
jgi:hypothetical protein